MKRHDARRPKGLDEVRARIDQIDAALLELMAERFRMVDEVRAAKRAGPAANGSPMRPAREAELMRRLEALRKPELPASVMARIWRELIGGATQMQAEMRVHIPATAITGVAFRDIVRDHFGTAAPLVEHADWPGLVTAAAGAPGDVAVVPASGEGWLEAVLARPAGEVSVIAGIPLLGAVAMQGYVLGHASAALDEGDRALIAVAGAGADDFPAGLSGRPVGKGGRLWLVTVPSASEAEVVAALRARDKDGGLAVRVLGSYPSPIG